MTKEQTKGVQKSVNAFMDRENLPGFAPLIVDGKLGAASWKRIRWAKYFLGYGVKARHRKSVSSLFVRRLRHEHSKLYSTPGMRKAGKERRKKYRADWQGNHDSAGQTTGVGSYDGVPCAKWMLPYLKWARENGWQGRLNSGWRDPAYSESLCYRMCGAPSCPGQCAGRASNHAGSVKPRGALDVSSYTEFGRLMRVCPHGPRIFNALGARDPVHFSQNGH